MSTPQDTKPPNETAVPTFPFEADANAKIAVLRAMAADFILPEPRSLTAAERRLVSTTPAVFVEKAANFGNVVPAAGEATKSDAALLREGEAYATAYDRFVAELESLRQLARKSIALRRLKTARNARSIYRFGKNYLLTEGGDDAKTHVDEMKKALNRRRRRPAPASTQPKSPQSPSPQSSPKTEPSSKTEPTPKPEPTPAK